MKGTYIIKIRNRRVTYTLQIERNITVICGDSGTGKTTLIQSVSFYEELGEKSGVTIESSKSCHVLSGRMWHDELERIADSFVFVDEGNAFISSKEFAAAVKNTDNYYILITRENLYQLPYSVTSILELKKTTSRFKHTYNRTYPKYDYIPEVYEKMSMYDSFVTEDTNAGNEFFSHLANQFDMECVSAGGKSRILDIIKSLADKKQIVVADGSAFGAEMAEVYRYYNLHKGDILLYLPESFEWLILSSGIIKDHEISEILESPSDYIESSVYMSWEQFFTKLLIEKTENTPASYSKSKLNKFYLHENHISRIMEKIGETKIISK